MNQSEITPETLAGSVISVPPLARNADFSLNHDENEKLIRHLEGGGVSTLLYGGNAILYHVALSEYAELLQMMTDLAGDNTLMIPSRRSGLRNDDGSGRDPAGVQFPNVDDFADA